MGKWLGFHVSEATLARSLILPTCSRCSAVSDSGNFLSGTETGVGMHTKGSIYFPMSHPRFKFPPNISRYSMEKTVNYPSPGMQNVTTGDSTNSAVDVGKGVTQGCLMEVLAKQVGSLSSLSVG